MAVNWLKIEKHTARKPEVLKIAADLKIHPDHAFGTCFRFWAWVDDNLVDGCILLTTLNCIDALLDFSGFGKKLCEVGWIVDHGDHIAVPNIDRHISKSAKQRALTAGRVAKTRAETCNENVTLGALPDKNRIELLDIKKKEKKKSKDDRVEDLVIPEILNKPEFLTVWATWIKSNREKKKPIAYTQGESQLKKLAKMGLAKAIESVNASTEGGWTGLFPPKEDTQRKPNDKNLFDGIKEFSES